MTVALPTEASKPVTETRQQTILLYGIPNSGKAHLRVRRLVSLFFEWNLAQSLGGFKCHLFVGCIPRSLQARCQGDHKFKTIVIDTVDNAFRCVRTTSAPSMYRYEGDMGHGKGWALVQERMAIACSRDWQACPTF